MKSLAAWLTSAKYNLSTRLILGVALTLLLSGAMLLFSSVQDDTLTKRAVMNERLEDELNFLIPMVAEQAVLGDYTNLQTILLTQVKRKDIAKIIWLSPSKKAIIAADDPTVLEAPHWFIHWVSIPCITKSKIISVGGVTYGKLTLVSTSKPTLNRMWGNFLNHLQILLMGMGCCIAVVITIIKSSLDTLRELTAGARKFGHGDYSIRIPVNGTPEVQDTIRAFNAMADNIEKTEASNKLLATFVEQSREAIVATDLEQRISSWNTGAAKLFGYTRQEAIGQPYHFLNPMLSQEELKQLFEHREAATGTSFEMELVAKNGRRLHVELSITPLLNDHDMHVGEIIVARDIGERKQFEANLFKEKERAQVTLKSIADAVITTDMRGHVEYLNPVAEKLTGWTNEEASNQPLTRIYTIVDEATGQPIEHPVSSVLRGVARKNRPQLVALCNRHGHQFPIEDSSAPIFNSEGIVIGSVVVFHDVSQTRQMLHQLSWQAQHDTLTGLVNRREFERRLNALVEKAMHERQPSALMYIDLDQFKIVNDTCGHIAGDELLRQISALLKGKVRASDTLARLGGDEFGVLLESCSIEKARAIAEDLRQTVYDFRFVWEDKSFTIGASIGVVAVNESSESVNRVLGAADSACYSAKDKGRNRIQVYLPDDNEFAQRQGEMQWVTRINRAFEENRFQLYYQSIVPLGETPDEGDHYELLIRMVDENGKLVPPMAFIPAAERYNLMPSLDRWVIENAFGQFEQLYGTGSSRKLHTAAINISGASLSDDGFCNFVKDKFSQFRVAPQTICFEITETAAIANLIQAARLIKELKAIGCRFSLDDFGSGMSSFGYLKNLPVDYLKIDGSFVKDMVTDPIDCAMVHAINQIGHVMGLQTIAEFVENDAILNLNKEMGVNYAQGYGIAKPRPLKEIQETGIFMHAAALFEA